MWWVFWWDLRIPLPEPVVTEPPPSPFPPKPDPERPIHLLLANDSYMACGLSATGKKGLRWTVRWEQATCEVCRQVGADMELRYRITTR